MELYKKITREIDKKIMKTGKMGTESVRVTIFLNPDEIELFTNNVYSMFDSHYFWEIEDNTLIITYTED